AICRQPHASPEVHQSLEESSSAPTLCPAGLHEDPGESRTPAHVQTQRRLDWTLQDLQQRIQKHTEVEVVDLVLKLKDKLSQAEREQLPVRPGTLSKLQSHIEAVILALPEDLQGILQKPPTS
ncbi:hypothetical protein XENOCAPTIV_000704, partial [Xenoophorus captivus]